MDVYIYIYIYIYFKAKTKFGTFVTSHVDRSLVSLTSLSLFNVNIRYWFFFSGICGETYNFISLVQDASHKIKDTRNTIL